jgi:ABC-type transporter Mla subunit MlaD
MRKLGAILFLVVLAFGVWAGARWLAGRDQLKATIIFHSAHGLRRGDPVVENQVVIGRVSAIDRVDDRDAVTVRIDREHRRAIVADSLFAIDDRSLIVTNAFAVGAPVENGAVLQAKDDKVSRWLAKNGAKVEPFVAKLKDSTDHGIETAREKLKDELQKVRGK